MSPLLDKMFSLLAAIKAAQNCSTMGPMEKQGTIMLLGLEMTVAINQTQLLLLTNNTSEVN